jgi:hypothetical protein
MRERTEASTDNYLDTNLLRWTEPIIQDLNPLFVAGLVQWKYGFKTVPFSPDAVIVRQVSYSAGIGGGDNNTYFLYSDLVDDQFLGAFAMICNSNPNSIHLLNGNSVNRVFNFWVKDVAGAVSDTAAGQLSVVLEFIKTVKIK